MQRSERRIDRTSGSSYPVSDPPRQQANRPRAEGEAATRCGQLLRQHDNTSRLLDLLEQEVRLLPSGVPDYALMTDILHYLGSYVDRYHHPREQAAFALAAERAPDLSDVGAVVAEQHETIIGAALRLEEDLERVQMDLPVKTARLREECTSYVCGLRNHMRYEETELLPRVCAVLGVRDWDAIDAAHGASTDPLFGPNVQARYRSLFEQLASAAGCGCRYR